MADSRPSNLGTEIVTIYVGPKRKEFKIHKKLICGSADYFGKAFNGDFKEAREVRCFWRYCFIFQQSHHSLLNTTSRFPWNDVVRTNADLLETAGNHVFA